METLPKNPTPNSYWVVPEQLLAGRHPGSYYAARAKQTLGQLLEANVSVFVDLTEKDEYAQYEQLVEREARRLRRLVAYYQLPIKDENVPTLSEMKEILDTIDTAISAGRTVYVHCLHGRGRTGTVIGCWLVRHGITGEEAIQKIEQLRQTMFDGEKSSPRTPEQRQMVLDWLVGK